MSKIRTKATNPRTVSLTGAELNSDQRVWSVGRTKEIIARVRTTVMRTAHDHSHQSRLSTTRMRSNRLVLGVEDPACSSLRGVLLMHAPKSRKNDSSATGKGWSRYQTRSQPEFRGWADCRSCDCKHPAAIPGLCYGIRTGEILEPK